MRVHCEVEYVELENNDGREVPGVCVSCTKCGHETESFGEGEASVKRCLALMREECPEGDSNFYSTEDD